MSATIQTIHFKFAIKVYEAMYLQNPSLIHFGRLVTGFRVDGHICYKIAHISCTVCTCMCIQNVHVHVTMYMHIMHMHVHVNSGCEVTAEERTVQICIYNNE